MRGLSVLFTHILAWRKKNLDLSETGPRHDIREAIRSYSKLVKTQYIFNPFPIWGRAAPPAARIAMYCCLAPTSATAQPETSKPGPDHAQIQKRSEYGEYSQSLQMARFKHEFVAELEIANILRYKTREITYIVQISCLNQWFATPSLIERQRRTLPPRPLKPQ